MIGCPQSTLAVDSVRALVRSRLAAIGHLEEDAFPMTERLVIRSGKPCGIYFCMHGPRSVKLTAVADLQRHKILYYGSDGQRTEQTDLPLRRAA